MSSPAPFADISAKIEAAALGYPIAYPNVPFKRPNPPGPWLRVDVTSNTLAPIELGARVWQEDGTAYVDVFVPAGSGSSTARTIAKDVANVFRGLGPEDVVYLGGSIGQGTIAEVDGMWWCLTVTIDWRYQDIST